MKNDKLFSLGSILSNLRKSLSLLLVFTFLLGVVYPLIVTMIAQLAFSDAANGSLITKDGKIIGSKLIGQNFTEDKYFWSRLSENKYDATNSGGSNLSIANPKLLENVNARVKQLQDADSSNNDKIPVELVTASASGLDPHISVASAEYQIGRVAKARNMKIEDLKALIDKHIEWQSKFTESPYINVLELNLALDELEK